MSTTEPHTYGTGDASFQAAGGEQGIHRLVTRFYEYMDSLPEAQHIRAMHPADIDSSHDKLFRFLCSWLGGPMLFQERYGSINIPLAHARFPITETERDAWLLCMQKAVDEQDYEPAFKVYLMEQLSIPAERIRAVSQEVRS